MKKFYLLFGMLLCCLAMRGFAQTITFTQPAPAVDGQTQVIKVLGELPTAHLDAASISAGMFHVHGDPDNAIGDYFNLTQFFVTPYSNCAGTGTGTTITFIIVRNNDPNTPQNVQLGMDFIFTSKFVNCNGTVGTVTNSYDAFFTSYPANGFSVFHSAAVTGTVLANNCPSNYAPLPITYTVPANHDQSAVSQLAADQAAQAYWNATKQSAANAFGPFEQKCHLIFQPTSIPFPITNSSGNTLSITFNRTDITGQAGISQVVSPHTNFTFPSIPFGTYTVVVSPGGMPVNCNMMFSNGISAPNTPGHVFTGVGIGTGTGQATSFSATTP